jgi:hypothetical protein
MTPATGYRPPTTNHRPLIDPASEGFVSGSIKRQRLDSALNQIQLGAGGNSRKQISIKIRTQTENLNQKPYLETR